MELVKLEDRIEEIESLLNELGGFFSFKEAPLKRLYEIHKELNPRDNPCFTCRGDRSNVVKWFKQKLKKWQTDL
jgi:hypothetical protein